MAAALIPAFARGGYINNTDRRRNMLAKHSYMSCACGQTKQCANMSILPALCICSICNVASAVEKTMLSKQQT